jgi:hypothetical protein
MTQTIVSVLKNPLRGSKNPTKTGSSTPTLSREERINARHAAKQAGTKTSNTDDDEIADPALLVNPAERGINYGDDLLVVPDHPSPAGRRLRSDYSKNAVA